MASVSHQLAAALRRQRVLAVSSGGGHWVELMRLRSAFDGHDVHYATVQASYRRDVGTAGFHTVRDATRWNPVGLLILAFQITVLVLRLRPEVVITTGAAPGYFAIRVAKLCGARTVWVDSLANVDRLSRSGQLAGRHVDLWLTQWSNLAVPGGPEYAGRVL